MFPKGCSADQGRAAWEIATKRRRCARILCADVCESEQHIQQGLHPLDNACSKTKISRKLHPATGMKSAGFFHG